jgi:GNAT superfamily N-acetyltransferase
MTTESPGRALHVRPVGGDDLAQWTVLYRGYGRFYGVPQTDAMIACVWSWLQDPEHELEGLVVEDEPGRLSGLAHYRPFARPLSATHGCYLDDLFVDPARRGTGAADLLLGELARLAAVNAWSVVRWITADDNYRGRGKYDQFAARTGWITYDMPPAAPG